MKKIILIASAFLFVFSAKSQTIRDSNIANIGDIIYGATDLSPSINIGTNSSGNTWNFSSLLINSRDTGIMEHPWDVYGVGSMRTTFPNATHGIKEDTNYVFMKRDSLALQLIGLSNGTAHVKSQDPEIVITFPSVFGTTFLDTARTTAVVSGASVGVPADSVKIVSVTFISSDFSASGTLTTPYGVFSCIRQYLVRITKSDFSGKSAATGGIYIPLRSETDTAYSHQYWSDDVKAKFPLVSYDLDASGNLTGSVEWTIGLTINPRAGLQEITKKSISVYPNPAFNQLTIEENSKINKVVVMDITGKTVISLSNLTSNKIDINKLPKGVYVIQVSTDAYVGTTKFIKQ